MEKLIKELKKNPHLTDKVITKDNYRSYYEFHEGYTNCKSCKGLNECKNPNKGYAPILGEYRISYKMCAYMKKEDRSNVTPLFISGKSLNAKLEDFSTDTKERQDAFKWSCKFVQDFTSFTSDGLYLYGPFGTGKTYLLSAIANELSRRNIKTILAFFPDLSRKLKSSINDNNLEYLVNQLKTVDCLMLDDFGGEMASGWLRDEIIAPLFQYRRNEGLPTFISSNLNHIELLEHLSNSKNGSDQMKANRIMERIKTSTILVNLKDRHEG